MKKFTAVIAYDVSIYNTVVIKANSAEEAEMIADQWAQEQTIPTFALPQVEEGGDTEDWRVLEDSVEEI